MIQILKIDETPDWCPEVREATNRVWSVYCFDDEIKVHCCELTPSYELHFVEYQPEYREGLSDSRIDEIDGLISGAETDDVRYVHCMSVDALEPHDDPPWCHKEPSQIWRQRIPGQESDYRGETPEDRLEEALEFLRCNQI